MGRPSSYTEAIATEICERLAEGESLRSICRDEHMPDRSTVAKWAIDDVQGFSRQYTQARDIGLDVLADEVVEIADEDVGTTDNGATDSGAVARNRLRFDARRWYLSKLAPKKYGDKQAIDLNAKVATSEMSEEEIRAELALLTTGHLAQPNDGSDLV